jgi:hypothetical protein
MIGLERQHLLTRFARLDVVALLLVLPRGFEQRAGSLCGVHAPELSLAKTVPKSNPAAAGAALLAG